MFKIMFWLVSISIVLSIVGLISWIFSPIIGISTAIIGFVIGIVVLARWWASTWNDV